MKDQSTFAGQISFILPIFNVGQYLEKCLDSIEQQTSTDWEALLIDDGSTDSSPDICKQYEARNPKFHYIRQENQGQGVARNNGIDLAKGKYICFVDPDDWIDRDLIENLTSKMNSENADFGNFGFEFITQSGQIKRAFSNFKQQQLSGRAIFQNALLDREVYTSPCNKIYRTSFLREHKIRFPALRAYEDIYFSRKLSLHATHCLFFNRVFYHALIRSDSTTRKLTSEKIAQAAEVIALERQEFITSYTSQDELHTFNAHAIKFITYMIFQAAFRVTEKTDYLRCHSKVLPILQAATAESPLAISRLNLLNRTMFRLAKRPRLIRNLAQGFARLGVTPY